MLSLTRDYTAAKEQYASLLKRLEESKLADSLEQRQKAERFRLLEAAAYPQQPAGPNRLKLVLIVCVLSIGAAAALMILWEIIDGSIHRMEDLQAMTKAPILGVVPQLVMKTDLLQKRRYHVYRATALTAMVFMLVGASYILISGNEQLVRLIVKS